jgi:hypothetical protein
MIIRPSYTCLIVENASRLKICDSNKLSSVDCTLFIRLYVTFVWGVIKEYVYLSGLFVVFPLFFFSLCRSFLFREINYDDQ